MKSLFAFMKKETVLVAAWVLAVISMFIVLPNKEYISYIDFKTLGILLALMIVMAGLKECRFFDALGMALLKRTGTLKGLQIVLVFLCFFSSMLITNDVALITFVPFAIFTLQKAGCEKQIGLVVVLQTIAANMGSMLTPFGNPQNLYLYSISGMSTKTFFRITIPFVLLAGMLLFVCGMWGKNRKIEKTGDIGEAGRAQTISVKKGATIVYCILFAVCLLAVFNALPYYVVLIAVILLVALLDYKTLWKADYFLLLTFVGFFIFIGNMGKMDAVKEILARVIEGREVLVSVLSSQAISNVPAALLLTGFSSSYEKLLIGLNVGGLGTLIASMANLISFKLYANAFPQKKRKYIAIFSLACVLFLIAELILYLIVW